jgi:hypothetical protein
VIAGFCDSDKPATASSGEQIPRCVSSANSVLFGISDEHYALTAFLYPVRHLPSLYSSGKVPLMQGTAHAGHWSAVVQQHGCHLSAIACWGGQLHLALTAHLKYTSRPDVCRFAG